MKKKLLLYHIYVLVGLIFFYGCATPIPPTGGPADKQGPVILHTIPETGTTNFNEQTIEIQFNEFVNRSSLTNNITIEPDLGIDFETHWKRKKLTIEFEAPLPDSTTVIVTLGAKISDTRNNKMGVPTTIAVSTGNEIDEGSIVGRLRSASNGKGIDGVKVLLYRSPIDLERPATYQAETDTGGVFRFKYLREGIYQALYVEDRNRNKIWDARESAQPFNRRFLDLKKGAADTLDVIYVPQVDTLAPGILGVGLFSTHRMRLRFDENIKVNDTVDITVNDTLGNTYSSAYPLYIPAADPFVLFAQSDSLLKEGVSYEVIIEGITDLAGNELDKNNAMFEGSSQEDTTLQRVIRVDSQVGLTPKQSLIVTYAAPIKERDIVDSLVIAEGEVTFTDWPAISINQNILTISPQKEWIEGVDYQFLVWNPATQRRQLYEPEIWDELELGSVEVAIADTNSSVQYQLSLSNEQVPVFRDTTFTGKVELTGLPPVAYKLVIYNDVNGNGKWDKGTVLPFVEPEPYYVQETVTVQTGFASEVILDFSKSPKRLRREEIPEPEIE